MQRLWHTMPTERHATAVTAALAGLEKTALGARVPPGETVLAEDVGSPVRRMWPPQSRSRLVT